jgi:putative ABC transport system permease protein
MPVALITAGTAKRYWGDQDPVGKHLKRVYDKSWTTVIGVVGDVNEYSLASRLPSFVEGAAYRPYGNGSGSSGGPGPTQPTDMTLVVRAARAPEILTGDVRQIVAGINSNIPLSEVHTLNAVIAESIAAPRSTMLLLSIFAGLALVLGAVGVYGVIAYGVSRRVHEIGVRMALGAQKHDVMWQVIKQGGRLALIGVGIGIAGAVFGTRLLSSLLFAVSSTDAITYCAVSLLLILVVLAACFIPARRAAKVDPMVALRYE